MDRRHFLAALLFATPALAAQRDDQQCRRIRQRLEDSAAGRRAGYTGRRGRKLLAQRQKLEEQRKLGCR